MADLCNAIAQCQTILSQVSASSCPLSRPPDATIMPVLPQRPPDATIMPVLPQRPPPAVWVPGSCYRDSESKRAMDRTPVQGFDACKSFAEINNHGILGMQAGGECWVSRDLAKVTQHGQVSGGCPPFGDRGVNRVYLRQDVPMSQYLADSSAPVGITQLRIRRASDAPVDYINISGVFASFEGVPVPLGPGRLGAPYPGYPLERILDNDRYSFTHTDNKREAEIVLDVLDGPRPIDTVTVWNRRDCCGDRIVNCVLEVLLRDRVVFTYRFARNQDEYRIDIPPKLAALMDLK